MTAETLAPAQQHSSIYQKGWVEDRLKWGWAWGRGRVGFGLVRFGWVGLGWVGLGFV